MDVVTANGLDDNRFPHNPKWRSVQLGNAPPDPCSFCPCGADDTPGTWNSEVTCTSQSLRENRNDPVCRVNIPGKSTGIPYHMNWFPVEYEGTLTSFEKQPPVVQDDEYNFFITSPGGELFTSGKVSIEIEFSPSETVNHWDDTHTWWDAFHHHFVDTNQGEASKLIKDKNAIVIGMLGLDLAHPDHQSEFHPVYAMFINLPPSPTEDKWAFFVRNWGNEGFCGPNDVPIGEKSIQVRLKKPPGSPGFILNTPNVHTYSHKNADQCSNNEWSLATTLDGVLLTFDLSDASNQCGFVGDLTIDWKVPH